MHLPRLNFGKWSIIWMACMSTVPDSGPGSREMLKLCFFTVEKCQNWNSVSINGGPEMLPCSLIATFSRVCLVYQTVKWWPDQSTSSMWLQCEWKATNKEKSCTPPNWLLRLLHFTNQSNHLLCSSLHSHISEISLYKLIPNICFLLVCLFEQPLSSQPTEQANLLVIYAQRTLYFTIMCISSWIVQAMKHELKIRSGDLPPQDIYQLSPSDIKQLLLDVLQPQHTGRYSSWRAPSKPSPIAGGGAKCFDWWTAIGQSWQWGPETWAECKNTSWDR